VMHRFIEAPVELELAKVAYNFWYAARKYRASEPLCGFFVELVEGRLPRNLYEWMQEAQGRVISRLQRMDPAKSGSLTYNQIATAMQSLFSEYSVDVSRGAIFAVAQTLEAKQISMVGSIRITDLTSDEKRLLPKKSSGSVGAGAASSAPFPATQADQQPRNLLANAAAASLPTAAMNPSQALAGASLLTKFIRRVVMLRCDAIFLHLEAIGYRCVKESVAMPGMFLLHVPKLCELLVASPLEADAVLLHPRLERTHTGSSLLDGPSNNSVGPGVPLMPNPVGINMSTSVGDFRTPLPPHDPTMDTPIQHVLGQHSNTNSSILRSPILAPTTGMPTTTAQECPTRLHGVGPGVSSDVSEDVPSFLHLGSLPICLGDTVTFLLTQTKIPMGLTGPAGVEVRANRSAKAKKV
jgi:hypothetical protein